MTQLHLQHHMDAPNWCLSASWLFFEGFSSMELFLCTHPKAVVNLRLIAHNCLQVGQVPSVHLNESTSKMSQS
jgi:hypothetical protein